MVACPVQTQCRQRPHGPVYSRYAMLQGVEQVMARDLAPAQQADYLSRGRGDETIFDSFRHPIQPPATPRPPLIA